MGIDQHLIHSCDVERDSGSGVDVHNNKTESWSAGSRTDVPFRLVEKRERRVSDDDAAVLIVTVYKGLFAHDEDIQEKDRLVNVTLEDGTTLSEKFYVEELLVRRRGSAHHKTTILEMRS